MMSKVFLIVILALAAPLAADFKPALQAELRGRYENQQDPAASNWGQSADILFIPAFNWGSHSLLPVMAVLTQGRGTQEAVDGAPDLFFVRRNTFLAKPTYRYDSGDWVYKGWLGAKRAVNAEKEDMAWSLGLYDWEEFAVGVGVDRKLGGAVDRVSAALELQHRTYMNWHEAGTGLSANKNYYTKDYNALKLSVSERSPVKAPLVWNAGFTWLLKAYTDSYVVKKVDGANGPTTDGTLDLDMLRADHLLRLAGDLSWAPGANFILATDLGVDWNVSNQNYFDAVATRGTLDFYGYVNTGGGLKLTWLPSGEQGPRLSLRGGLGVRAYTGRLARTIGSGYFTSQQMDIEETLDLDSAWPLPVKGLAVVGGLGYDVVISNQSYSPGTLSNYQLFNASLGLQYKL